MVKLNFLEGDNLSIIAVNGFVYCAVSTFAEFALAFIAVVALFFLLLHVGVASLGLVF